MTNMKQHTTITGTQKRETSAIIRHAGNSKRAVVYLHWSAYKKTAYFGELLALDGAVYVLNKQK